MHTIRTFGACLLAVSLGLAAAPASASEDCEVPIERWQSRDAVDQLAGRKGWDLARVKIDDGCYEIAGRDADGRSFKATLDPETLDIVKMKYRDRSARRPREGARPDQLNSERSPEGGRP
ncbi:PepSY domain-containing protein [Castellaniella sp. GW247-6E4]|uniref:PepSY domain-containing protein n=1 Tax=Castellaniella sp. GW247-6E4 TaxID=3140380 RepID=UPI0033155FD3